jgi:hypothetical protein
VRIETSATSNKASNKLVRLLSNSFLLTNVMCIAMMVAHLAAGLWIPFPAPLSELIGSEEPFGSRPSPKIHASDLFFVATQITPLRSVSITMSC